MNNDGSAEKILDDVDASIDQAQREIRAFTYLLHPQNFQADGLKTTIEQFVDGFATRTSLQTTLKIAPEVDRLSYERQRAVLRVYSGSPCERLPPCPRHPGDGRNGSHRCVFQASGDRQRPRHADRSSEIWPQGDFIWRRNSSDESQIAATGRYSRNPFLVSSGGQGYHVVCSTSARSRTQESAETGTTT